MSGVDDYEIERQIGAGASGTVWKAHRRGTVAQIVALKRLRADSGADELRRIRREATILAELDHPHIVRVLDVLDDGDSLAIAMSLAPGGALDALLESRGRLTPGEAVAVAVPVAEALASAHRRGIVHGDVKPANILFTSDSEPLLSDFGVARTLGTLTSDSVRGTAGYLAPELLDGGRPGIRSDIYSLGVVCYEAIAGKAPYTGESLLAVARAAERGDHRPLAEAPDVPRPLAEVVEQAMARQPEQRFASAEIFATALRAGVDGEHIRLPDIAAAPAARPDDEQRPGDERPSDSDDVPAADASATSVFGPRPPAAVVAPPAPGRRRLPAAVGAAVLVAVGFAFLLRTLLTSGGAEPEPRDPATCPDLDPPPAQLDRQIVRGDPEGNGCEAVGTYELQEVDGDRLMALNIEVERQELQIPLGEQGDRVFIGDWNCDGADTPGLYRTTQGELQYFHSWPDPDARDEAYLPDEERRVSADGLAQVVSPREGDDDECQSIAIVTIE